MWFHSDISGNNLIMNSRRDVIGMVVSLRFAMGEWSQMALW